MDQKTNWKYILIILILAALVGGGILACKKDLIKELNSLVKFLETSKAEKVIDTSGWQTYRNEKYGFELKYPLDWVDETNRSPNSVLFLYRKTQFAPEVVNENKFEISFADIELLPENLKKSFEDDIVQNENDSVGGLPAVRKVNTDRLGFHAETINFKKGESVFYINFSWILEGNEDQFMRFINKDEMLKTMNQILSTFKFIE